MALPPGCRGFKGPVPLPLWIRELAYAIIGRDDTTAEGRCQIGMASKGHRRHRSQAVRRRLVHPLRTRCRTPRRSGDGRVGRCASPSWHRPRKASRRRGGVSHACLAGEKRDGARVFRCPICSYSSAWSASCSRCLRVAGAGWVAFRFQEQVRRMQFRNRSALRILPTLDAPGFLHGQYGSQKHGR